MDNILTPIDMVIEQAAVKYFFTGGAHELFDEKFYKHSESQDYEQYLVRDLIKSSAYTVPVTSFDW